MLAARSFGRSVYVLCCGFWAVLTKSAGYRTAVVKLSVSVFGFGRQAPKHPSQVFRQVIGLGSVWLCEVISLSSGDWL